jgi:hypothetical protein
VISVILCISFDLYEKKIYFRSYFKVFGYFLRGLIFLYPGSIVDFVCGEVKCACVPSQLRSILLAAERLGSSVQAAAIFISFSFSDSFPGARTHTIVNSGLDFLSSAADFSCSCAAVFLPLLSTFHPPPGL